MNTIIHKLFTILCALSLFGCHSTSSIYSNLKEVFSVSDESILEDFSKILNDTFAIGDSQLKFLDIIAYEDYFLVYGEADEGNTIQLEMDFQLNDKSISETSRSYYNDENYFVFQVYLKNQTISLNDILSISVNQVNVNGETLNLEEPIVEMITIDKIGSSKKTTLEDATIELTPLYIHIESSAKDVSNRPIKLYDSKDEQIKTDTGGLSDHGGNSSSITRFFNRAIDVSNVEYITVDDVRYDMNS